MFKEWKSDFFFCFGVVVGVCFRFLYFTKKKNIPNFNRARTDSASDNIEFVKIHLIQAYRNTIKPVIYHFNP